MKITDLLSKSAIQLNGIASSKDEVISKMVDLMMNNENITNKEEYKRDNKQNIDGDWMIISITPIDPNK